MNTTKPILATIVAVSLISGLTAAYAQTTNNQTQAVQNAQNEAKIWIGAWIASQQPAYGTTPDAISLVGFNNQTVRMIINPKASGSEMRIRLSNLYGTQPLTIGKVTVAIAGEGASTVSNTSKEITFGGESTVTIPPGAEFLSDAIPFEVTDDENLAVSVYVPAATGPTTWHRLSNQTTYISTEGDHTADSSADSFTASTTGWFWLSGIDVVPTAEKKSRVIVVLGDSITDGHLSTLDANHRWPDFLDDRLDEELPDQTISVLNAGISGNRILRDAPMYGVNALARLNRDVLSQTGVTDVILLEGINDIGQSPNVHDADQMIAGMKQIAEQAHAKGVKIYVGTLSPFRGYRAGYFTEEGERTRQEVNAWIRNNDVFDGVIDFDKALSDPDNPDTMLPSYDGGDHLHPGDEGYKAMADAVDLNLFK